MRAVRAGQDAAITQTVDHVIGFFQSGRARRAIAYEVHAQEKSRAADISDEWIALLERLQAVDRFAVTHTVDQMAAHAQRALLKFFILENIEHGQSRDRKSTRLNSSHGYISYAV